MLANGQVVKMDADYDYEDVGHPLTWGRIEKVCYDYIKSSDGVWDKRDSQYVVM